jgi:hypothetical protein
VTERSQRIVYVLQAEWGGPVKIGTSRRDRLDQRIREVQTGNPSRLILLRTLDGGHDREAELHRAFACWRLHGEWFIPSDDLCEALGIEHELAEWETDTVGVGSPPLRVAA